VGPCGLCGMWADFGGWVVDGGTLLALWDVGRLTLVGGLVGGPVMKGLKWCVFQLLY